MNTSAIVDIIIPVHNEAANIGAALAAIDRGVPTAKRVLVVHDTDEDDTVPSVRTLRGAHPWVELVRNDLGPGVAWAIRAGLAAASAEVVVVSMADLADDPAIVPEMVSMVVGRGYDLVCASRYMPGGRRLGGPILKGLLSRFAGLSLHRLAGVGTRDATNAFRAYRRAKLVELDLEGRGGFALGLEILAKGHAAGWRIGEVPTTWRDRSAGASRFRLAAWLPTYLRWYLYAITHRPRPPASVNLRP